MRRAEVSGADAGPGGAGEVLAGPGREPVRGARRINAVLTAVRAFIAHAVATGQAPGGLLPLIYELADDRDLPEQARGEDGRMSWRMRARHRLREPETAVDRASDEEIVALLGGCRSARDRLIVLLMARAGLRRGELCGLRRSDVHLLLDSRLLGCETGRAHLHVVRRDNANGAWAKSRRQRSRAAGFPGRCRRSTPMSSSGWPSRGAAESDFRAGQLVPRAGRRADAARRHRRAGRRRRAAGRAGGG